MGGFVVVARVLGALLVWRCMAGSESGSGTDGVGALFPFCVGREGTSRGPGWPEVRFCGGDGKTWASASLSSWTSGSCSLGAVAGVAGGETEVYRIGPRCILCAM